MNFNIFVAPFNFKKIKYRKLANDRIFDRSRKRYVKYTPEEQVRQSFISFLLSQGYPLTNIKTEQVVEIAGRALRADIVVYKNANPIMVVECKAPNVELTQSTIEQIWLYNYVLGAKYLVLTNGKKVVLCEVENDKCNFLSKFLRWDEIN